MLQSKRRTRKAKKMSRRILQGSAMVSAAILTLASCALNAPGDADAPDGGANDADGALVKRAKEIVALGVDGLIHANVPENDVTLDDWQEWTEWTNIESTPTPPENVKLYSIACVEVAPFCHDEAQGAVDAARELGWDAIFLDGEGGPDGYAKAFQTAIAGKADVIVTNGMPESVVGQHIAKAHSEGISVVGIATLPNTEVPEANRYDAYVSSYEIKNAVLQALYVVADSNGTAKVVYIWDPSSDVLEDSLIKSREILEDECTGCEVLEIVNTDIPTMANPVTGQELAQAVLQRHPDVEYVILPYGLGTEGILQAPASTGRTDVKFVGRNSDPANVGFVGEGVLAQDNGAYPTMIGWSAIDQAIRVLTDNPPLDDWAYDLPMHIYTPENTPDGELFPWETTTDFKQHFERLWGLQ